MNNADSRKEVSKYVSGSDKSRENGACSDVHLRLLWLRLWTLAEALYRTSRGKGDAGEIQGFPEK